MRPKYVLILMTLIASLMACQSNPAVNVPLNGLVAAFHFCPVDECKGVNAGPSTKQLQYKESDGVYDRWCVEVLYERNGKSGQAAVEIVQTGKDANSPFSWAAFEPVYNSDCSAFK